MAENNNITSKNGVDYYKKGWKQKIGQITKVYVKGTDYERGVQFGKLLKNEIKSVFKHSLRFNIQVKSDMSFLLKSIFKWFPFLVKPLLFLLYRKKVETRIRKYPDWMVTELEGMARGAGIHPFYLKYLNAVKDEEHLLGNKELFHAPVQSCCSFAFTGWDGNIYHGKNLDWIPIDAYVDLICLQQREDETGNWFSIIQVPGFLDAFEYGMNSHGISIGLTGRFFRGKRASSMALTNAVELEVLRNGKNLKEIQEIYNTKTGFNRSDGLLISSVRDRDYKLFEVSPRGAAVTPSEEGVHITTNTYVHPALRRYDKQWGNIYDNQFCDPRYIRLRQLMQEKPGELEDAFDIIADTLQPGSRDRSFLGQATINRFITHVSAVMVQGKETGVWIAKDRTYSAYNEFSYFDFSSTPRETAKIRPADNRIHSEEFKTFKEFIRTRENRYYMSAGKIIEAAEAFVEKDPDNPVFILFLVQNCLKYKRSDQALSVLKKHPVEGLADYWYCLGKCYREQQTREAVKCFEKAMPLPSIDGFSQLVKVLCLVQLVKLNKKIGLHKEAKQREQELNQMKEKFSTPNIGMPDYPFINNISEQMEDVVI
ncbi:MAG: hypothetical protein GY950_32120 [bacterium]|nr:hypothetical protein [bacterium]